MGLSVSRSVARVGFKPESQNRFVFFRVLIKKLREPRRSADEHYQNAGRKRIECSRVSDALRFQNSPQPRDDIVRRVIFGFVYD